MFAVFTDVATTRRVRAPSERVTFAPSGTQLALERAALTLINVTSYTYITLCLCALALALAESLTTHSATARAWRARLTAWRGSTSHSISAHESTSLVVGGTLAAIVVLGAVASSSEDDVVDAAALGVLALVCATIGAALLALGALLAFVASPVGAGAV